MTDELKPVEDLNKLIDDFNEKHLITDLILLGDDGHCRRIILTDEGFEGVTDGNEED